MTDWVGSFSGLENWFNAELIFVMCQRVAIIFVIAFLFSKSKAFELLVKNSMRNRDWLVLYAVFFFISTMGSVIADQITIQTLDGSWLDSVIEKREVALFANSAGENQWKATIQIDSRAIGSVLAGLLGGPILGGAVGISTGLIRYIMGGDAAIAGALGTAFAGLFAGFVYMLILKINPSMRFNWKVAFFTAFFLELVMKGMVVVTNPPLAKGLALIQITAIPNTFGNAFGVALFVTMLNDYDKTAASFSTNALQMAAFFARVLKRDISRQQKAFRIANFIQRKTGIAAVAITDQTNLAAFKGMGADHHHIGDVMATGLIKKAIDTKEVIFIDGYNNHFLCKKSKNCPLHSALIAPVIVNDKVEGAILLFETKHRFFPKMNRELGKGLASLLSEQILAARYPKLLAQAEDKHMRAKVDPHFFANALTTISAITRKNEKKARVLLRKLAALMRERIDPKDMGNTLAEELAFLTNYIDIEKERFGEKLQISADADPALLGMVMPRFVLQLLVENAIKHGVSKLLDTGYIEVNAYRSDNNLVKIDIKDSAGQFCEDKASKSEGHGLKLVDDLIKAQFNSKQFGVSVQCQQDEYTIATLTLPFETESEGATDSLIGG